MTQTHTSGQAMLSPEEIYNLLMGQIEPDLTTDMLPVLDELYMDETNEEREKRGERYGAAFADFELAYDHFISSCVNFYTDLKKKAKALAQKATKEADTKDMNAIEDSLSQS